MDLYEMFPIRDSDLRATAPVNWRLTFPERIRDEVANGSVLMEFWMDAQMALELADDVEMALKHRNENRPPDT